jgi:hypothetical protein
VRCGRAPDRLKLLAILALAVVCADVGCTVSQGNHCLFLTPAMNAVSGSVHSAASPAESPSARPHFHSTDLPQAESESDQVKESTQNAPSSPALAPLSHCHVVLASAARCTE